MGKMVEKLEDSGGNLKEREIMAAGLDLEAWEKDLEAVNSDDLEIWVVVMEVDLGEALVVVMEVDLGEALVVVMEVDLGEALEVVMMEVDLEVVCLEQMDC
jgi:hypothetical protein